MILPARSVGIVRNLDFFLLKIYLIVYMSYTSIHFDLEKNVRRGIELSSFFDS